MKEPDAARPVLALHIGLPKTGTTFLQQRVFPRVKGLTFLHRKVGAREERICLGFRSFAHRSAPLLPLSRALLRRRLAAFAAALPDGEKNTMLISEENISLLADAFWKGQGSEPEQVARRLDALSRFGALKVIITIRRQDQWLASRYAESSKHFRDFSQSDFDRRMCALAAGETLAGPFRWLDYDQVERCFAEAVGQENILMLPLERLSTPPAFAALGGFLGLDFGAPPRLARTKRRRNQLSLGEDVWRMRSGGELRLEAGVKAGIIARFVLSNAKLSQRLRVGFEG